MADLPDSGIEVNSDKIAEIYFGCDSAPIALREVFNPSTYA